MLKNVFVDQFYVWLLDFFGRWSPALLYGPFSSKLASGPYVFLTFIILFQIEGSSQIYLSIASVNVELKYVDSGIQFDNEQQ